MRSRKPFIIGLVGLPGAGKTTAASYLELKGFSRITLSDFIKEEAKKAGITEFTRENLQDYGNKMREQYGPQVLAQLAHKKIRNINANKVIIDGIRNLYEIAFLEVENNFSLLGITAKPKLRYERLISRKNRVWSGSYEEFLAHEKREQTLGSREIGLRVNECMKKAAYVVSNNTTEKEFKKNLDAVIRTILISAARIRRH